LRLTLLLALPSALALAILAVPLISTLFHHGAFDGHDVAMTGQALVAYSVGLVGLILVKVLAPGFYARQNIRTPVKIGIITLASTQLMNLAFIFPLRHAGLALAIGLGACFNAGLLYFKLRQQRIFQPQPGWARFALQLGAGLLVMGLVLWFVTGPQNDWLTGSAWSRALRLTGVVVGRCGQLLCRALARWHPLRAVRQARSLIQCNRARYNAHFAWISADVRSSPLARSAGSVGAGLVDCPGHRLHFQVMRILRHLPARAASPVALTVGNFDGVHLGHRAMLELLDGAARERRLRSCVMSFEPHPREFFSPDQAPTRLTSLREKLELLAQAGIDQVHVRRFDYDFARVTAEEFIDKVLVTGLGVRWVLVGDDFRFGARRQGDVAMLRDAGRQSRLRSGADAERDGRRHSRVQHRGARSIGEW
jgi:hypothetical protein